MAFICSKCEHINLSKLLSEPPIFENGRYIDIRLEHESLDDLDPECGLCSLLRAVWPGPGFGPPHYLTTQSQERLDREPKVPFPGIKVVKSRAETRPGTFVIPNMEAVTPQWLQISATDLRTDGQRVAQDFWVSGPHMGMFKCIMEASTNALLDTRIDFRRLGAWIEYCCHNHDDCKAPPDWNIVKGMRLIDIRNRSVVSATNHQVKYAALSYVWGVQQLPKEAHDGLAALLPRTIEDAIQATRELGLDYLWVDKYCIPQHNEKEKQNQINNMHRVYRQAYVTLVAAAGTGPDHGLPGVSCPRTFLPHTLVDKRLFVGLPGNPLQGGAVQQSPWNTRAWTYQENFFSRRILYFTDSQVVFNCKQKSIGIEDPIRNHALSEPHPLIDDPTYYEGMEDQMQAFFESNDMRNHIMAATERQITYETDRINTIAGILSHMKAKRSIMGHLSGVPIWTGFVSFAPLPGKSAKDGFFSGLAWSMDYSKGRRVEFPSWSWAGWKGRYKSNEDIAEPSGSIWFELQPDYSTVPMMVENEASFERAHPQKQFPPEVLPSKEFWPRLNSDGWKDSLCRFIHIEAPVVRFRCKRGHGRWFLSSLEGYPIHEDTIVGVDILVPPEEDQLEEMLTSNSLRGIVLSEKIRHSVFVMVLRDFPSHSERIGSWKAGKNLFVLPQVGNEIGSKRSMRVVPDKTIVNDHFEKFTGGRRERVRLG